MLGWTLAWLGGTAAIAGYSIVRHAPALERLMLDDVHAAVTPLSDAPLTVSVRDHVATLSGTVDGAAERDAVLAAAGEALGIRRVVDRLVVSDPVPSTVMPTATGDATDADEPSGSGEAAADAAGGSPLTLAEGPESARPTGESSVDELPPEDEFEPDEALEAERELAELPSEDLLPEEPDERIEAPRRRTGTETPAPEESELAELPAEAVPSEDTVEPDVTPAEESELAELPAETPPPGDAPESDTVSGETLAAEPSLERGPPETAADAGAGNGAEPAGGRAPTLRLDVVDRVLTMEGSLSKDDDAAALVLTAMDSFELDYVSNTLESEKDVAPAGWLEPISALLPEMTALDDPGIEVSGRQVTLYGTAPDAATRGAILGMALERLGDYSLVERIDVGGTGGDVTPGATSADEAVAVGEGIPGISSADERGGDGLSAASDTASPPTDAASTVDGTASDAGTPDAAPPDTAAPDVAPSDVAAPDVAVPDGGSSGVASSEDVTPDEDPAGDDSLAGDSAGDDASDEGPAGGTEPLRTALLVSPRAGDGRTEFAPLASPVAALRAALATLPAGRILFESGSDTLTEESRTTLDDVAAVLLAHPGVPVAIEGHTDGRGLREANLDLSQRRANAVRDHLVSRGVSYGRLTAYGYGEGVPIADNATPEGRAANRRIEFTF